MPLRDDRFPDGFHWLSGSDKLRTEAANILYENTVLIAQTAIDLSIAICIENPSNSLMWKTSPFQRFFANNPTLRFINFHNCAHGGTRDKKTCFVTSVDWFDKLEIYCDKQHTHAPWHPTVIDGHVNFPTHAEAAYPEILCNRCASMLKQALITQGAIEVTNLEGAGEKSWQEPQQSCPGSTAAWKTCKTFGFGIWCLHQCGASTTTRQRAS